MVSAMRRPPSSLIGAAAGFLENTRGGDKSLLLRGLVGAERQVDHHQRALRAAHHRAALHDHHVEGDRQGALDAVHHHAEQVADQDDVAMLVEDARGVGVIGGERDDRVAALAGADIGRRQAPLLWRGPTSTEIPCAGVPKTGIPMNSGWNTRPNAR